MKTFRTHWLLACMAVSTAFALWACKGEEQPQAPSNPSMEMDAGVPGEGMGMPDAAGMVPDAAMMMMDAMP